MAQGTVKWFNSEKGFGFITPDGGGCDLFAHYAEIQNAGYRTLEENQRVEFEITQGQKGPQASNIRADAGHTPPPPPVTPAPAVQARTFIAPPAPKQGPMPVGTVYAKTSSSGAMATTTTCPTRDSNANANNSKKGTPGSARISAQAAECATFAEANTNGNTDSGDNGNGSLH